MHVVFTLSNTPTAPYFEWFAQTAAQDPELTMSFVVLHSSRPTLIDFAAKYGFECYWIYFDQFKRKSSFISSFFKLRKLFKKIKPDVVHTHLFDDSLPSLLAARITRVKKRFITKGDTGFHYYYAPKWVLFDKFNNWNATKIVAISSENKSFIIEKEKANPEKIVLIHHGIPREIITGAKEELKKELSDKFNLKGRRIIGSISRFIKWKGHENIIKVAEKLKEEYPDILFLWIGGGELETELRKNITEKDLDDHILIIDRIPFAQIPSLYALMEVYLHAANMEPFGFVIIEAMMNGIPVVSTPTGSAKDAIIHQKNGILCPYNDADALAAGVKYFLNNNNPEMKKQAIRDAINNFDFPVMYNNYKRLFIEKN